MTFSSTWDLEKYKSEFESDEHWELRKKFMQAHKDQFPEEKLVCLARVFCNIEFLGCRYPEKTMKLVAELAKGVADDYREKQKGKLKRTFVQASDAAGAKVKGRGATPPSKMTEGPPSKIAKTSDGDPSAAGFKYSCFVHEGLVKPPAQEEGEFPGFIIYENCKSNCPINILTVSAQKSKIWNVISFDFPAEKNSTPNERCCEVSLNEKFLSSGIGLTNKEAKVKAATEGLNKLRQTCYTIQEKLSFFSDGELVGKEQVKGKGTPAPLPQENIGSKIMMKMGWTGAGLGKNQQGIQAPIEVSQTKHRAGFGRLNTPQFQAKFKNVIKNYIASESTNDLVFAPDFSAEERKTLHKSAEVVEKVNQGKEEDIKKGDKCRGEDLFGFDSDSEVIFPSSSDEEEEKDCESDLKTCEVCCKLNSLTGEESDDDLFDKMWETGSDTSGLVNILEDIHMTLQKSRSIEGQADNIETNIEYTELNQSLHKCLPLCKSFTPNFNTFIDRNKRVKIFLPDGSFRRFSGKRLQANEELMDFLNNRKTPRITVTYQDLRTNKALRDFFPDLVSKLDSEDMSQSLSDNQANCERPTTEIDPKKISDLNPQIKTVSDHQVCETSASSNDGILNNIGNPSSKSMLPNIETNFADDKAHDTRAELSQTDEMKLGSSYVTESHLSNTKSIVQSEAISQPRPKKNRRLTRILFKLADGTTMRVNGYQIKDNNYFIRHVRRENGIAEGLFKPDEFPPPEYSDSSSDESETEWVPKTNLLISEPEGCEIDEVHVLRRRWEQFIVRFGSSKRNPFAKRWQNFVDQSPLDERMYLCQKWKEYLTTYVQYEVKRLPASILQPGHELVALSHTRQAYTPPSGSSPVDANLTTVYLPNCGKMKISKHLILDKLSRKNNQLSISADQISGFKEKIFSQSSESETTKNPDQLVQYSGNIISKLSEDKYPNYSKTDISETAVEKTSFAPVNDDHHGFSESGGEYFEMKDSSSCETGFESYSLLKRNRGTRPRVRVTLCNGSKIRIKSSDLQLNKYFVCHKKRLDSIKKGLINPDEIPPPDYSDSSTDEDETDWVNKSGILITEPENCEIDKNHILRKRWEQYILTIGSSKRNPFAKKWREFVEKSPANERKTLCQKWKDFMTIIHPLQGSEMPESVLYEGHKPMMSYSQAENNNATLSLDSSEPKVSDELLRHLQESTVCSTQSDLEKHINSSGLTVVHSAIDPPPSPPFVKNKRAKSKKNKNPNLVTAYLGYGIKVKVDYTLIRNKKTPDWLDRIKV